MSNESVEHYARTFQERFNDLKIKLKSLYDTLSKNNHDAKVRACIQAADALNAVKEFLRVADRPHWIEVLENAFKHMIDHPRIEDSATNVAGLLLEFFPQITAKHWDFTKPTEKGIDFEATYDAVYLESSIPRLFDHLIDQLQQIVGSPELDSKSATEALERLIATIRRNTRGSYLSVRQSLHFAKKLMRNVIWEYLHDSSVTGPLLRGVNTTIEEIEQEFEGAKNKMELAFESQTTLQLPSHPIVPKSSPAIPSSISKALPNPNA